MKNNALRDMIPLALLSVLCLVTGTMAPAAILACITCGVYQALYQVGQITPTAIYTPKSKGKDGVLNQMYKESHPIVMPSLIYTLLGLFYIFGGIMVLAKGIAFGKLFGLFLLPISIYFWNWSSLSFKMAEVAKRYRLKEKIAPKTATPPFSSQYKEDSSELAKQVAKQAGKVAGQVINSQPVQDLKKSLTIEIQKSLQPKPEKSTKKVDDEAARQEKIMRTLEAQVLEQIEKNDQELRSIRSTSVTALDSIFGGSQITKARFQQGIDKAIEMSAQNLEATKEYVKVGHNPEVLQKFLNRSNLINKETGDLLDALVKHQQNQMEDSLKGLTESLDELQDSLKYYS